MPTSDAASKGAQGALFALAGLCFLLPFVSLSCSSEEASQKTAQSCTGMRSGIQPRMIVPGDDG